MSERKAKKKTPKSAIAAVQVTEKEVPIETVTIDTIDIKDNDEFIPSFTFSEFAMRGVDLAKPERKRFTIQLFGKESSGKTVGAFLSSEEQLDDPHYEYYYYGTESALYASLEDDEESLIDPRVLPKLHVVEILSDQDFVMRQLFGNIQRDVKSDDKNTRLIDPAVFMDRFRFFLDSIHNEINGKIIRECMTMINNPIDYQKYVLARDIRGYINKGQKIIAELANTDLEKYREIKDIMYRRRGRIILDSATDMWKYMQEAEKQFKNINKKGSAVTDLDYGKLGVDWVTGVLGKLKTLPIEVIICDREKALWGDVWSEKHGRMVKGPTETMVQAGQPQTPYNADLSVHMSRDKETGAFLYNVKKIRCPFDVTEKQLSGKNLSYAAIEDLLRNIPDKEIEIVEKVEKKKTGKKSS